MKEKFDIIHINTYIWGEVTFEWDIRRELANALKHAVSFKAAKEVFEDPDAVHLIDKKHSTEENRYFAVGRNREGVVLTVRYTRRENVVRIFGAACWRKWRRFYEKRKNTRSV